MLLDVPVPDDDDTSDGGDIGIDDEPRFPGEPEGPKDDDDDDDDNDAGG